MRIITETADLQGFAAELEKGPFVAIDTEFMRDQTYWPKLCLIQAAGTESAAIIDPLAPDLDLSPLYNLLSAKKVMKVFHAARPATQIFHTQATPIPVPPFDTQIAAMVCGFGDSASSETLVRKITNSEIDKSARFTDWSRRPLSKRQLEYALADVTHLRVVYETLSHELEKSGRAGWVEEEEATLKDPATYRLDPNESWRRLKVRSTNRRFLAVLAEVAAWREREAQPRDSPRSRVRKDEALLEIAAHPPTDAEALERIRAIPNGYANSRGGKALLACVKEALEHPRTDIEIVPERKRTREPSPAAL